MKSNLRSVGNGITHSDGYCPLRLTMAGLGHESGVEGYLTDSLGVPEKDTTRRDQQSPGCESGDQRATDQRM